MKGLLLAACAATSLIVAVHADDSTPASKMSTNTAAAEAPKPPRETTPEGCIIERFTVHSPSMDRDIQAAVVLPPEYESHPDKKYPVLYTFHGSDAPYDTYAAMPPLRAALRDKPMIVVCFDGDASSCYLDSPNLMKAGRKGSPDTPVKSLFTTFFLKELIPALDAKYRIDTAKRMLTGFSMGGFGAIHYMLEAPGEFVSVSSMSGWFPDWSTAFHTPEAGFAVPVIGPYESNTDAYHSLDVMTNLKKQIDAGTKIPPIYLCCGTEDHLLSDNHSMRDFLTAEKVRSEYHESPGAHNWHFWRDNSAAIIDFHWSTLPK